MKLFADVSAVCETASCTMDVIIMQFEKANDL